MTIDNILAVTLIPFFGSLSDRTNTKFGRRMPFLLIGIPLSAILFSILPTYTSFLSIIGILFILNLSMATYRAPTVALMPDITPIPLRGKANGIINFMGGLAAVIAFFIGARLYDISKYLPFVSSGVLMVIATIALYAFIKEPKQISIKQEEKVSITACLKEIFFSKDKTTLYLLLAIFFWFIGYQGMEATFSNYSVHFLGMGESSGAMVLGFFSITFLLFAIPSGFISSRFGKKKVILIGITGLIVVFSLLSMVRTTTSILSLPFNIVMMMLFAIGGFFWAFVNINSYPMVVEMTTEDKIGTYTGLYYFFSSLAAITGPLVFGLFVDLLGYESMFITGAVAYALAFICILKIKPRESKKVSEVKS